MRVISVSLVGILFILGCNPFENQQNKVSDFMHAADIKAREFASQKGEGTQLRSIQPYTNYTYKDELSDPFKVREFIVEDKDEREEIVVERENQQACLPPDCYPPAPHPKSILEEFTLESLNYVGLFSSDAKVALIQTPTYGVVKVRIGDYLGKDNGRIIEIKDSLIIIQEKIRKAGLWKDKKTIMKIRR